MALFRTEAIVLRAFDFADTTQIAHFYSPDRGKFSAIAKGVKRFTSRLGPRLEAFAVVEAGVFGREGAALGTVSSIDLLRDWPFLRADLTRHALAALVIETLDRGTQEAKPGRELFHLAVAYLEALEKAEDPESLTIHALLKQLCFLGYAPDLREPEGGNWKVLHFDPGEGRLSPAGPVDRRIPTWRFEASTRAFLRESLSLTVSQLEGAAAAPKGSARALLQVLIQMLEYYIEAELKSARFMRKMIWGGSSPRPL